jgi:hypothetical protein
MIPSYTIVPVRAAAILTTGYVAGTVLGPNTENANPQAYDHTEILVSFTKGSLTTAELKVEYSNDGTTYYQLTDVAVSGITGTASLMEYSFSATGNYQLGLTGVYSYIKISVKGTGTLTSSSMKVDVKLTKTSN